MAFDINEFAKRNTVATKEGGFDVQSFVKKLNLPVKQNLASTEGLYDISQRAGGTVAQRGQEIMGKEDKSVWDTIKNAASVTVRGALDLLSRPNYAIASAVSAAIDKDPETGVLGGLWSGITGETKTTFHDVFSEAGWNPETRLGKIAKGVTSFATDVLLDPTTYVTFGTSAGVKVLTKSGSKILTREGAALLAKGLSQKAGEEFGAEFVKKAIVNMAEKSPALAKQFFDQGGVKFFGKTIISGGRIRATVDMMPGLDVLDEATQPLRNTLYALFNRDASAKFGRLPQEFVDLKQKYLDLGRVKSADAIDEAINIAKANHLTSQEAELISNAIEAKLPLADERLNNARGLFEQVLGRNLKEEVRRGIEVGELPNYVPHILVDEDVALRNIPFKPEGARVSLGASKERSIGVLADETIGKGEVVRQATIKEINETFGKEFFDPNIVNAVAVRSVASNRAVIANDFLREIGAKFGALTKEAPSNYIESGAKELAGLKFHPAIAEQLDNFKKGFINDEATNVMLKAFDKVQNLWKASVTSIFPAFHGRNAVSNVFLNFLDIGRSALSPAKHGLAIELQYQHSIASKLERAAMGIGDEAVSAGKQLSEKLGKVAMVDNFGKSWTYGKLFSAIKDNRVAFGDDFLGFLDIPETISNKLGQAGASTATKVKNVAKKLNPLSTENYAFAAGRAVGNTVEQQARILNFITNLEKTGDVTTAAQRTKQFLFDYQNLSDFERNVMRRLVPFYTFTRKNIALQVEQLGKQPGKYAGLAKLFTNISKGFSDAQLTDEERENLPEFMKQGLGLITKKDGADVEMITSLGSPFEQIFSAVQKNQLLSSLSPIIAVPLQLAVKRNFFKDKPIAEDDDASAFKNAPDFVKDYIGFKEVNDQFGNRKYVALNPMRLFIMQNLPPTARVLSSVRQMEAENVSGKLKVWQQLTGVKPYFTDLERNAASKDKKKYRELQDLLENAGIVATFEKAYIPKAKKQQEALDAFKKK